jgi:hypothetical protein
MDYNLDNRIVLSTEREHTNLYSWSIKEFDKNRKQIEHVTEPDSVQVYVHVSPENFDRLMQFVKFPRPTGAEIRLTGVSGFYSEWSPSIRTDNIKILANAKDQRLENPQGIRNGGDASGAW